MAEGDSNPRLQQCPDEEDVSIVACDEKTSLLKVDHKRRSPSVLSVASGKVSPAPSASGRLSPFLKPGAARVSPAPSTGGDGRASPAPSGGGKASPGDAPPERGKASPVPSGRASPSVTISTSTDVVSIAMHGGEGPSSGSGEGPSSGSGERPAERSARLRADIAQLFSLRETARSIRQAYSNFMSSEEVVFNPPPPVESFWGAYWRKYSKCLLAAVFFALSMPTTLCAAFVVPDQDLSLGLFCLTAPLGACYVYFVVKAVQKYRELRLDFARRR